MKPFMRLVALGLASCLLSEAATPSQVQSQISSDFSVASPAVSFHQQALASVATTFRAHQLLPLAAALGSLFLQRGSPPFFQASAGTWQHPLPVPAKKWLRFPFTDFLVLFNVMVYSVSMLYDYSIHHVFGFWIQSDTLYKFGAESPPDVFHGDYWRLVTAGFLHGGLLHLLLNMWFLTRIGPVIEKVYSVPRFVVIFVLSTISGFIFSAELAGQMSIGASAGLMGLIGALTAYALKNHEKEMLHANIQTITVIFIQGLIIPGIDNAAHVGGLLGGFIVAYLAGTPKRRWPTRERLWHFVAWVAAAAAAYSFWKMAWVFPHASEILTHSDMLKGLLVGVGLLGVSTSARPVAPPYVSALSTAA